MIKPEFEISRWARWSDISPYGSGGFHLGLFVDWEAWSFFFGLDLGLWCLTLRFPIPITKKRRDRLLKRYKEKG